MPIYRFACNRGHLSEHLLPMGFGDLTGCDVCGNPAHRQTVNRVAIGVPAGPDSRGMFRRFTEASAEIDHAASKIEANTGQPVQTPDLWSAAKQRAAALERAGENTLRPLREST